MSNKANLLRLAWVILAVCLIGAHLATIPYRLSQPQHIGWSDWSGAQSQAALADLGLSSQAVTAFSVWTGILLPLVYISLGILIFWLKSSERMAVLIATVLLLAIGNIFDFYAVQNPAWSLAARVFDSASSALLITALYLFPDGLFNPPWTRWFTLGMVAIQTGRLFLPELYDAYFPPIGAMIFLSIPIAQIYRYRRGSNAVQRQQIKWVVYGLSLGLIPLGIFLLFFSLTPELQQPTAAGMLTFLIGNLLWDSFLLALPTSLVMAILRSRLWEIDIFIRRTLVYSLVTTLLALVYFGGVTLFQNLFQAISGQTSTAAIVISTLTIAALFNPLRNRIQELIDRRFYRQKYNAEQALADFAATARSETDLQKLNASLVGTIQAALQPDHISIWMKPASKHLGDQFRNAQP